MTEKEGIEKRKGYLEAAGITVLIAMALIVFPVWKDVYKYNDQRIAELMQENSCMKRLLPEVVKMSVAVSDLDVHIVRQKCDKEVRLANIIKPSSEMEKDPSPKT